jgi:hypothetical protein
MSEKFRFLKMEKAEGDAVFAMSYSPQLIFEAISCAVVVSPAPCRRSEATDEAPAGWKSYKPRAKDFCSLRSSK